MEDIDYKIEVLKVHPTAFAGEEYYYKYGIFIELGRYHIVRYGLLSVGGTVDRAWVNAYEKLRKEGKV